MNRHFLLPLATGLWILAFPSAQALTDTNANGFSDDWEKAFNNGQLFSAVNPAHIPAADPDKDGWTNLQESTAGTNPFDPLPPVGYLVPSIAVTPATYEPLPAGSTPPPTEPPPTDPFTPTTITPGPPRILLDPTEVRLTWPTVPGKTYRADLSADLITWAQASGTFVGSGQAITYDALPLHSDGSIPEKLFWRVVIGDTETDGDTISDYEEMLRGLNPLSTDTDRDGIPDNLDPQPQINSLQATWDVDATDPSGAILFAAFNFTPPTSGSYPFTAERVTDISGNTRHGKARMQSGGLPQSHNHPQQNAEGISNNGFHFANTHHFAFEVKSPVVSFSSAKSLSFWIKTKASDLAGVGQPIFCYVPQNADYNASGNSYNQFAIRAYLKNNPSAPGYEIVWLDWRNPGAVVRDRWLLSLSEKQIDGQWMNLSFVWKGQGSATDTSKNWLLYHNGNLQTRTHSLPTPTPFLNGAAAPAKQDTFLIGAVAAGGTAGDNLATVQSTFKGSMDRVRLHTTALSQLQVQAIVAQDADSDGLWDATEVSATAWKDTNSNNKRDPGEIFFPNGNPLHWQPSSTDTDSDDLTDIYEQNTTRTVFYNHDTDDDLLPDGWEHTYGLNPLSSAAHEGQTGDPDGDGLDNFDEWRFLSRPKAAPGQPNSTATDTDGDGTSDGAEKGQGTRPADPTDNGQVAALADKLTLKIIVGDPSSSNSERWRIEAEDIATGAVVLRHSSRLYGQMSTAAESTFDQFKPGKAYRFKLRHAGTDPAKLAQDPEGTTYPDYDWSLQISYKDAQGNFINLSDPTQTKYLVLDPYNADTKTISQGTPKLLATEVAFASIGNGTNARPAYREQILPIQVVMLPLSLTPDTNRDGKIDHADRGKNDAQHPWHFWINDDNDAGETEGDDIPQGPETAGIDGANYDVDGIRDLVDFFPLDLGLSDVLKVLPESKYTYRLFHPNTPNGPALKIIQAGDLSGEDSGDYLTDKATAFFASSTQSLPVHNTGRPLDVRFIEKLKVGTGLLLVEAIRPSNQPVRLQISRKGQSGTIVAEVPFHIRFAPVENLYRHLNLRDETGGTGGVPDQATPPSYPDELCNADWFILLHGYNVNGEQARGWHAESFKRLFWSGSRAKFVGVSWQGDETQALGRLTPKYFENVENGLNTAPLLAQYVNGLTGGKRYLAGHSLGSLVISEAIANQGAEVEKAFLLNPALPSESLLPKTFISNDPHMEPQPWRAYPEAIKSSEWYRLFPAADGRSNLTWRGLFNSAVPKLEVLYSPGEEVLTAFPLDLAADPGIAAEDPTGKYAFALQALLKGMLGNEPDTVQSALLAKFASFLTHAFEGFSPASDTAGWAVNGSPDGGAEAYNTQVPDTTFYEYRPPAWFNSRVVIPAFLERLKSDPAFSTGLPADCSNLYDPTLGSQVAAAPSKFRRMLGQMIPERSLPAGGAGGSGVASEAPSLEAKFILSGGVIKTYDLQSNRNGWPVNRPLKFGDGWRHSDIKNVSYLYVHKAWDHIVEEGNLNHE